MPTMSNRSVGEKLAFVRDLNHEEESAILARAVQEGIQVLFREALIEAYLVGRIDRADALAELGAEDVERIEEVRDTLIQDIRWGSLGG